MDDALANEWVMLDQRKRELEAELKDVEARLKPLEQSVLEDWANSGTTDWTSKNGRTVYLFSERRPQLLVERPVMAAALKQNGLANLVKEDFNLNSLRSVMLDDWLEPYEKALPEGALINLDDAIPEAFRELMKVSEKFSIRSCASKRSKSKSKTKGNEEDEPF